MEIKKLIMEIKKLWKLIMEIKKLIIEIKKVWKLKTSVFYYLAYIIVTAVKLPQNYQL